MPRRARVRGPRPLGLCTFRPLNTARAGLPGSYYKHCARGRSPLVTAPHCDPEASRCAARGAPVPLLPTPPNTALPRPEPPAPLTIRPAPPRTGFNQPTAPRIRRKNTRLNSRPPLAIRAPQFAPACRTPCRRPSLRCTSALPPRASGRGPSGPAPPRAVRARLSCTWHKSRQVYLHAKYVYIHAK
jgi:hypothetical protein